MTDKTKELEERSSFVESLDRSIDLTTAQLLHQISEDRERAVQNYQELLSLFNQGKNSPDDLRELNKAQEIIQATTEQMQKLVATLTKIKTGADKMMVAQISGKDATPIIGTQDLIDLIERSTKELPSPQDNGKVEYRETEKHTRN